MCSQDSIVEYGAILEAFRSEAREVLGTVAINRPTEPAGLDAEYYLSWVGNADTLGELSLTYEGVSRATLAIVAFSDQPKVAATMVAALLKLAIEAEALEADELVEIVEYVFGANLYIHGLWTGMTAEQRTAAWKALAVCSLAAAQWIGVHSECVEIQAGLLPHLA
jgi:hypothetical protein